MHDDAAATAAQAAAERETRLRRIEEELKKLQPKRKDGWEKLQALTPLVSGVLLAFVGYFLTGSVNNAIQRQQLQLSNVKEMRELLAQLETADSNQADVAAFTLSAFGRPAVPPLMAALLSGGEGTCACRGARPARHRPQRCGGDMRARSPGLRQPHRTLLVDRAPLGDSIAWRFGMPRGPRLAGGVCAGARESPVADGCHGIRLTC